jgi:small redox-active disulfide protein 2
MMKIQILGTGCAKCQKLAAVAEDAARALGLPYEIQKVTDLKEIMGFGVVKVAGKVPSLEDVKKLLT